LIERQDLLDWRNEIFRQDNPDYTPAGVPPVPLPPFLSLPSRRTRRCPYTGLGRTVMHGLTSARQPYGPTGIIVARYRIPGLGTERLAIDTDSLLRYLRSLPPPHYKIADPGYPSSPGPEL
jgi:hypothetical protein